MREGVTGLIAALLLGLGIAWVPSAPAQSSAPAQQQEAAQTGTGAAARQTSPLTTITPDAVDCHLVRPDATCTTGLTLRPAKDGIGKVMRLTVVLAMPDGSPVDGVGMDMSCTGCSGDSITIPATPAVPIRVTLQLPAEWRSPTDPRVASGVIGFVPADGTPALFDGAPKRLRVLAPSPSEWQTAAVAIPALLALLVAVSLVIRLWMNEIRLRTRMGAPSWKAGESWASNLTVGAALVNGAIALGGVIGDFTLFMTKPAYGVVSMLLASLVLIAPLVYGLARQKNNKNEYEGFVAVVVLTSALILWASGGQLFTFALLILEVWRAGALAGAIAAAIVVLTAVTLVALLVYGHVAVFQAIHDGLKPPTTDTEGVQPTSAPKPAPPAAPTWTLP